LGHLTRKTVPDMTYIVFGGTLDLAQLNSSLSSTVAAAAAVLVSSAASLSLSVCLSVSLSLYDVACLRVRSRSPMFAQ